MNLFPMKKIMCSRCGDAFQVAEDVSRATVLKCPSCGDAILSGCGTSGADLVPLGGSPSAMREPNSHLKLGSGAMRKRVAFRCARYGMKFTAWFAQCGANEAFILDEIEKHDQPPSIVQLFRRRGPVSEEPSRMDDIGNFDLTGWMCPYCKHGRTDVDGAFFACSCGELVCGGRSRRTLLGATIFRCHDGCGVEGRATGAIRKITSRARPLDGVRISRTGNKPTIAQSASVPLLSKK